MKLKTKDIPFTSAINPGNNIQWRSSVSGPFLVSRCTEVLPGFINIIEEDIDCPVETEFGPKFTRNKNISLVLSGSFEFIIDSHPASVVYSAGEMMPEVRYKETHTMKALDKSNAFVCITPIKKDLWKRNLYVVTKNVASTLYTNSSKEQYIFIALGYCIDTLGELYMSNAVHKVESNTEYNFNSDITCYIIHMWK